MFPDSPACSTCMSPHPPQHVNSSRILPNAIIHSLLWTAAVQHHFESWLITTCLTTTTVLYSYQMAPTERTHAPKSFFSTYLLMLYPPEKKTNNKTQCIWILSFVCIFLFFSTSNMRLTQSRQTYDCALYSPIRLLSIFLSLSSCPLLCRKYPT